MESVELFVVGAGFTKAFVPKAPVMLDFFADQDALLSDPKYKEVKQFAKRCGIDITTANIETLLTFASIEKPWMEADERKLAEFVSEQLRQLIDHVLTAAFERNTEYREEVFTYSTPHESILNRFSEYLLRAKNRHVVTFNYDALLENRIKHVQYRWPSCDKRFWSAISYGFPGQQYNPDTREIRPAALGSSANAMKFLKLHGSQFWSCRKLLGAAVLPEHVLIRHCHSANSDPELYGYEKTPFIVPPIMDKKDLQRHPVIAQIWEQAVDLIRNAKSITFLGFSFPATDYYADFIFRYYVPTSASIHVVDYAREGNAEHQDCVRARYATVFPHIGAKTFSFKGAVDYCSTLQP